MPDSLSHDSDRIYVQKQIPVNFIIMRYSIIKLAYNSKSEDLPYPKHAAITITLLVATTAFVLMLNAVGLASGDAFSLILDLTGGISGIIFPQRQMKLFTSVFVT